MTTTIRLQREAFDVAAEAALLTRGRTDIGAVVTFTGLCRADENGEPIAALTLEHYPDMAEAEIARHVEEARARWPLMGVTVIHRYGRIAPGEVIVLVVTASSHREAAFAAASFLMDYLKTRAPFWKQVEKVSGQRSGSTPRPPTMPRPSAGRRHRRGAKRRSKARSNCGRWRRSLDAERSYGIQNSLAAPNRSMAAPQADVLQSAVGETSQLDARIRAILPCDKTLPHMAPQAKRKNGSSCPWLVSEAQERSVASEI